MMGWLPVADSARAESCAIDPGTNDRCPAWEASPPMPAGSTWDLPVHSAMSRDGTSFVTAALNYYGDPCLGCDLDLENRQETTVTVIDVASGQLRWRRTLRPSIDSPMGANAPTGVAIAPDGSRVYVTVQSLVAYGGDPLDAAAGSFDAGAARGFAIAMDGETGAQEWRVSTGTILPSQGEAALDIAIGPDAATIYVSGMVTPSSENLRFYAGISAPPGQHTIVAAIDAATGRRIWTSGYADVGPNGPLRGGLTMSADGSRLVQLMQIWGDDIWVKGYALVSFDAATGSRIWAEAHLDAAWAGGFAHWRIATNADATEIFVAASDWVTGGPVPRGTFKMRAHSGLDGKPLWEQRFDPEVDTGCPGETFLGNTYHQQQMLAVGPSGDTLYLTGSATLRACGPNPPSGPIQPGDHAQIVVAFDTSTGAARWTRIFDGPGADGLCSSGWCTLVAVPGSVGEGGIEKVIAVSDYSFADGRVSLRAVALDGATGHTRWSARRMPGGSDRLWPSGAWLSEDVSHLVVPVMVATGNLWSSRWLAYENV